MFTFSIETPDRRVYTGKVAKVHLTSEGGEMELYPEYANFIAAVGYTKTMVHTEEGMMEFVGRRGIVRFDNTSNTGLLQLLDCHLRSEFTIVSAKEYLQYLEGQLASEGSLSDTTLRFMSEEKYMLERQVEALEE